MIWLAVLPTLTVLNLRTGRWLQPMSAPCCARSSSPRSPSRSSCTASCRACTASGRGSTSVGRHDGGAGRRRGSRLTPCRVAGPPARDVASGRRSVAGPLLGTKLHVPRRRRGLVSRPRLSDRLTRADEPALVLVSAPAGFGKTTLVTEWLAAAEADGRSIAWLSLDERDNDPAVFWTYLVAALRTAAPEVGAGALDLLQSPQSSTEAVLATLLDDLSTRRGRRRPGARRLPRHRVGRRPGRRRLPARAPAAADPPGDRDAGRPVPAARSAAGAAASWSRSAQRTCASPPTRRRPTSATSWA